MSLVLALLVAAAAKPNPWNLDSAPALAEAAIGNCVSETSRRFSARSVCVRSAFETCEKQRGNMSQRDLTACAVFSRRAWEKRRLAAMNRLISAKQSDPVSPSPAVNIAELSESEKRWEAWNRSDCEMQATIGQGGTYYYYALEICLSDHAAHRAIELEYLSEEWGRIFKLDDF